ncbi:MAG: hypothetical protein M3O34_11680, partial [Chloroflexota bacterium]|nr:hypothetical protein [Chloroflexota bacterium]
MEYESGVADRYHWPMLRVLVRGVNDVASAVAHRLFTSGHAVAMHDAEAPTTSRRGMACADAMFDGRAELAGVAARRLDDLSALPEAAVAREAISVNAGDFAALLAAYRPDVLVDARMRKRAAPEIQSGLAPLTVGLEPGFVAGQNVDLAIETGWGDDLGRVIERGPTRDLAGEPRAIDGVARERYVYAPAAGVFRTDLRIGSPVGAGQVVAHVEDTPLLAPIDGALRGLTRDGVAVAVRAKVIEVDPRGTDGNLYGIGERPGRIADGVL